LPASQYEFFFKYNKNQNDEDAVWTAFIDNIAERSKKKSVSITIIASASRVPTRAYKNNSELASTRAKKLQDRIKEEVAAKGGNVAKLRFLKNSVVGGPRYKEDAILGREKYEKHQFVKAKAR